MDFGASYALVWARKVPIATLGFGFTKRSINLVLQVDGTAIVSRSHDA
jgi:hypothetical protein